MRSEDRTETLKVARRIVEWVVGLDDLTTEEIEELKLEWQTRLVPGQQPEDRDNMWNQVEDMRRQITHS